MSPSIEMRRCVDAAWKSYQEVFENDGDFHPFVTRISGFRLLQRWQLHILTAELERCPAAVVVKLSPQDLTSLAWEWSVVRLRICLDPFVSDRKRFEKIFCREVGQSIGGVLSAISETPTVHSESVEYLGMRLSPAEAGRPYYAFLANSQHIYFSKIEHELLMQLCMAEDFVAVASLVEMTSAKSADSLYVHKHTINKKLRSVGYEITSDRNRGYRLVFHQPKSASVPHQPTP